MAFKGNFRAWMSTCYLLWVSFCCQMIWDIFDSVNELNVNQVHNISYGHIVNISLPLPSSACSHSLVRRHISSDVHPKSPRHTTSFLLVETTKMISFWRVLMVLSRFYAPVMQLQFHACDSLTFGGRGVYFANKRRKRLGKGTFNSTLGYPGEGPKKRSRRTLEE